MKLTMMFKSLGLALTIIVASQTALLIQQGRVSAEPGSNKLNNGESLKANEFLVSSDGRYKLL